MTTLCFLLLASHAIGFCADAGKSFRGAFDDVTSDDFAAGPSAVSRNIGGSRNIFFRNVWKNSKFITDTSMSIAESRVEIPLSMSMMMEPPDFDYFMSMSTSTSMYTSTSMSMSTSMSSSMSMSMSMSLSMSMVLENPNGSVIDGPETKAPTKSPSATPSTTSTVTPSTTAPMASPSTAPTAKPSTAPTVDGSTAEIVLTYRAVVSDNITSAILNDPDSIYQVELLESISMWATETVSDFKRMESKKNPMFTLRRLRQQTPTDAKARGLPIYHRRLIEVDETSSMKVIDVECSDSIKARIECGCYIEGETKKLALHNSDHCIEVLTNVTISLKDKPPNTNKADIVNYVEDQFMLELEDPEFHSAVPLFIKREIRSIYSSHLIESTIPPAKVKYLQPSDDNGLETPLGSLQVLDYAGEMDDDDLMVENESGRSNKVYITVGIGALALMVGIIGLFVYHLKQRDNASSDKSIVGDNTTLKDGNDSPLTPRSVQYDLQPVEDLERGNDNGEGSKAFSTRKEGSEGFYSRKNIDNITAGGATAIVAIESYDARYSSGSDTENPNFESEDESERSDGSDFGRPPLLDEDNSTCTSSSCGSELADAVSPLQTSSKVLTRRISELTISSDDEAPIFASTIELAELRLMKAMQRVDDVSECSPKQVIYLAKKELCEAKENLEALRMMIKSTLYASTSTEGSKSDVPSLPLETVDHAIVDDKSPPSVNSTEMVDRTLHQIVQSLPEELIQHFCEVPNEEMIEKVLCQIVESDDFVKLLVRSGGDVHSQELSETDTTAAMTDSSHTTLSRSNSFLTNEGSSNKSVLYQIVESLPDDFDTPSGPTLDVVKQVLESEGTDSNPFSETMDDDVLSLLYRRFVRQFEQSERSFDGDNSRDEIIQYRQGFKYAARNTFNIIEMIMNVQSLEKGDDDSLLLHNAVQNISCGPDLLRFIIETNMEMVAQSDSNGNLPLHYAALVTTKSSESLSRFFITELLYAYPEGAGMTNAAGDLPINLAIESSKDWIGTGMLSLYEAHPHGLERNVNEAFHSIPAELDSQVGVDGGGGRYRKRKQRKMISKDECHQSMQALQNPDATVRDIVFTMWANEEDEDVQILGCSVLELAVTATGLSTEEIASVALLGVNAVVNAMRNHPNEPTVQGKACSVLIALSPAEGLREVSFAASGAIASIVNAMKTHVNDATIQEEACKALQSVIVAGGSENATVVACVGGFTSLVYALAAHPHDAFVQIEACLALELLTSFYDKYERHQQIEQLLQAAAANYPDDCLESTNAIRSNLLQGSSIEIGNKFDEYELDVTDCGIQYINGRYHQAGLRDDVPQYVKIGEYHGKEAMFHLSRWQCVNGTRKWYITATIIDGHQERHFVFYVAYETNTCSAGPPLNNWMAVVEGEEIFLSPKYKCKGTNPVPVMYHLTREEGIDKE